MLKDLWEFCKEIPKFLNTKNFSPLVYFTICLLILGVWYVWMSYDTAKTQQNIETHGDQSPIISGDNSKIQNSFNKTENNEFPKPLFNYNLISPSIKNDKGLYTTKVQMVTYSVPGIPLSIPNSKHNADCVKELTNKDAQVVSGKFAGSHVNDSLYICTSVSPLDDIDEFWIE